MKKNYKRVAFLLSFASVLFSAQAQESTIVSFDPSIKRILGKTAQVSTLKRDVYFNMHSAAWSDSVVSAFSSEYDVGFGRSFWGPFSYAYNKKGEVGVYPTFTADNSTSARTIRRYIATEHPNLGVIEYGKVDPEVAGKWAADYYANSSLSGSEIPEFFEPLNEPFVHANDDIFAATATQEQMKTLMTEFFREIGKQIDENPRLSTMKVIGYARAWPSMELYDFGHWEDNMKRFIDGAGDYMDAISIHLYDGINVTGESTRRSGSNSEAILDLTEAYTYIKYGAPRPLAISEYGCIDDTELDYYSEIVNSRTVGSINHLLFNLLDRQDNMLISVPFLTDKSTWHLTAAYNYIPYGPVIFLPEDPQNYTTSAWYLSEKAQFYSLWKGVNGDRIDVQSSNPDVQVQAFRDGSKIYIAMDNLDDYAQEVELQSAIDWSQYSNITLRSLTSNYDLGILFEERSFDPTSEKVNLDVSQVSILIADVACDEAANKITRHKYYSNEYLKSINANQAVSFSFDGVSASYGRGTIRMTIGRSLTAQKIPTSVKINGVEVDLPTNWKGYDQSNRDSFFGMIEIPFSISLLNSSTNEVSFTFSDAGGHVAAAILQVESYDENPYTYSSSFTNGGFEDGNMLSWIPWSSIGSAAVTSAEVSDGLYAAQISGGAGLSQIISVDANCNYRFSADIKVKSGKALMGVDIDGVTAVESTSSSFTQQSIEFNSGDSERVRLYIDAPTPWSDEIVVDNVSIVKI